MSTIKVNALRHTGGSSDNISLDSSGRVAMGTSTAGSRLQVNDDITTAYSAGSAPTYIARFENLDETTANTPAICSFRATGSNSTLSIWYAGNAGTTTTYTGSNFVIGNRTGSSSYAERLRITGTGDLQFNSGYGSVATAFGVRAWINFDGTAATIGTGNGSGNMDAVTDNGTGDYTVNFTNDMPDANYGVMHTAGIEGAQWGLHLRHGTTAAAVGAYRFHNVDTSGGFADVGLICIAFVR